MTSALVYLASLPADVREAREDSLRITGCLGKERYATAQLAFAVAQRRNRKGRNVSHYLCSHCDGFHLGTKRGGKRGRK